MNEKGLSLEEQAKRYREVVALVLGWQEQKTQAMQAEKYRKILELMSKFRVPWNGPLILNPPIVYKGVFHEVEKIIDE